jgi:hypothetical protein
MVEVEPELRREVQSEELDQLFHEQCTEIATIINPKYGTNPEDLTPISRRIAVRSIAALIEAKTYSLKIEALSIRRALKKQISAKDMILGYEETYDLDDKGEPIRRIQKLRTLPNILYAFKLYGRYRGCPTFELDTSVNGWQQIRCMFRVRDRLMHPKAWSDIQVNDEEIINAVQSLSWFFNEYVRLIIETNSALIERVTEGTVRLHWVSK